MIQRPPSSNRKIFAALKAKKIMRSAAYKSVKPFFFVLSKKKRILLKS